MSGTTVTAEVHGLAAFRGCDHEHGIAYRAVTEAHGPAAVAAMLAASERAGMLCDDSYGPAHANHFAVLDLVDEDGDILADRCIPTVEAWAWWRKAIELRATSSDCRVCEPAAYAATYAHLGR